MLLQLQAKTSYFDESKISATINVSCWQRCCCWGQTAATHLLGTMAATPLTRPCLPALSAGLYRTVLPFVLQTFKTKNFEVAQCPGKASTATRSSIKFKQASGWAGRAGSCPAAVVVQLLGWALSWQTPGTYAGPL